ncbi:hypothetical protein PX554_00745 [Sphingomonas sp. H39-1-10]|uniref:hypothetical protein n=1 Tax=Sphingomonas TaxID=13687 RepID=UPI00088E2F24|nr:MULTISPECIES: hypothetical protein [Sphingomonas]MDF0486643.1 hypothetical protein [Sphingomonas pollutisoli]SDA36812.1 hypothetical protein SAMN03159340_03915 [Sphingomonas sp. NFR15]
MRRLIDDARRIAAAYLAGADRMGDARIVREGGGDDYVEVRVALEALAETTERVGRLERALACYADASFWETDCLDTSLAHHDQGEIARSALDGKELYGLHRD